VEVTAARTAKAPQIAFYRENDSGEGFVYLVNPDGSGLTRLARGGSTPCSPGGEEERSLDWSADGRLLVYTDVDVGNATSSVEVIQPGGRRRRAAPSGAAYLSPRISPNGRLVVYCYETDPEARDDSMVVDVSAIGHPDGSRAVSDPNLENAFEPAWSPRSDAIAYVNLSALVIVTPSGRRNAMVRVAAANPDWSPSGARIAYATPAGIETVQANGQGRLRVAGIRHAASPVWSPRGRTIAFSASSTGSDVGNGIYEANPDGSGLRRMTPPSLNAIEPDWSPDGTKLAFVVPGKGIWVADATKPGEVERITHGNDSSPAWRPR
jgi:Tol biopolymer transport system component